MHEKDEDDDLAPLPGEPLTVTFDVAVLAPGTFVFLDAEDELLMTGVLDDSDGVPPALPSFGDDKDTDPHGVTIVGPLLAPRAPASPVAPPPARTETTRGSPIQPRPPVPTPDQLPNEIDDDDLGGPTPMRSPINARRPAPAKVRR